ncbi:MAG: N-acetyltransferase [Pseudomonadota bacterium]
MVAIPYAAPVIEIVPETPARDAVAIEALYDRTFGPGHFAKTAERLREYSAPLPAINRLARQGDAVIGVCRVWPIRVGDVDALFFGPVAVDPRHQGHALGLDVTAAAMEAGRAAGWPGGVLIGASAYFSRIGFSVVPAGQISFPGPQDERRVMVCDLAGRGLDLVGAARAAPA